MNTPHTSQTTRPHSRTDAGFTLVELLIVMSVILIIMAIAIPGMQKAVIRANETSAVSSVRMINTEENEYSSQFPQHGFACSLASLGGKQGSGTPTPEAAQLINEDLASGTKSGYTFTITCSNKQTINNVDQYNSYTVSAVPNSLHHTGNRGFCADEDGQIHYDPKGATNCTDLLQ